MGLQRTPPQKAGPSIAPTATESITPSIANTSLPSPSRAFQPRNQRVLRTPPPGLNSSTDARVPMTTEPTLLRGNEVELATINNDRMDIEDTDNQHTEEEERMEVDSSIIPDQDASTTQQQDQTPISSMNDPEIQGESAQSQPDSSIGAGVINNEATSNQADPRTPAPKVRSKTRKSIRQSTAQILSEPPIPIPVPDTAIYGSRYSVTMDALDHAIKAGVQRWTAKDLKGCFPILSQNKNDAFEMLYKEVSGSMREAMLEQAQTLIHASETGPALQLIDEVVNEAREHQSTGHRVDAWRPDIKPKALAAAANLPVYDEAYARIREEYLTLQQNCITGYASLRAKQAELKALEEGVADGVVDLEKTIQVMENFPTDEMMDLMLHIETVIGSRGVESV